MGDLIPIERIEQRIYVIRGCRVMLDRDLAELYGVPTKVLNQAVKRHRSRFPADFMLRLTWAEAHAWRAQVLPARLRSQIVTLKRGQHIKFRPCAFTEHGILMLSSVLNSERAVQVNIEIMRAFLRLRRMVSAHRELAHRLDELELEVRSHGTSIHSIFKVLRRLAAPPAKPRRQIGFRP